MSILKNSLLTMIQGKFLYTLKIDRYFPEISWIFFLCLIAILFHIGVDASLLKVEENNKIIRDLEIEHTQKVYEAARLSRRSTVIGLLEDEKSTIKEPEKPAWRLK